MKMYLSPICLLLFLFFMGCSVKNNDDLQQSELFVELPDYCPTPDGMAIASNGDLVVACPNFADLSKPACIIRINQAGEINKWFDVPVLEETGRAAPMGIAFDEDGSLYIWDIQGWSGASEGSE